MPCVVWAAKIGAGGGLTPFLPLASIFSSLDGRKEAKEDQGLYRGRGSKAGYMICLKNVPGKTSQPRQGPSLDGRKEAKEDQGLYRGRGSLAGYLSLSGLC